MQIDDTISIAGSFIKLPPSFYQQTDVVSITRDLLGKLLVTNFDNRQTAGRIVEAEAYNGPYDRAAHSFNNRRTRRTEVMYNSGGISYIYLCYGMHQMFNIVTNVKDVPSAILVRAIEPVTGIDIMLTRTNKSKASYDLTRGPGNVAKALGIHTSQSGLSLQSDELYIADDGFRYPESEVVATQRIGVDYAGEDALLPYRFIVKDNKYVSGKKTGNQISL